MLQNQSHESVNDDQMIDKNDITGQIKQSVELDQSLDNLNPLSQRSDAQLYDRNFLNPEGEHDIIRLNRSNLDNLLAISDPDQNPVVPTKYDIQMQHVPVESQFIDPQISSVQNNIQMVVEPVLQSLTDNIEKVDQFQCNLSQDEDGGNSKGIRKRSIKRASKQRSRTSNVPRLQAQPEENGYSPTKMDTPQTSAQKIETTFIKNRFMNDLQLREPQTLVTQEGGDQDKKVQGQRQMNQNEQDINLQNCANKDSNMSDDENLDKVEPQIDLQEYDLPIVEMFQKVEVLRAGTFKYEKNPYYTHNLDAFMREQEQDFDKKNLKDLRGFPQDQIQGLKRRHAEKRKQILKPTEKHIKTFIPIFPFLYHSLKQGCYVGDQKNLRLTGKTIHKNQVKEEVLHRRAQIKFSIQDNVLLKYEESRPSNFQFQQDHFRGKRFVEYVLELDFKNIKKMWISRDTRLRQGSAFKNGAMREGKFFYGPNKDGDNKQRYAQGGKLTQLTILIQLKRPCQALKYGPYKDFSTVSNAEELKSNDKAKASLSSIITQDDIKLKNRSKSIATDLKQRSHFNKHRTDEDLELQRQQNERKLMQVRSPFNMTSNIDGEVLTDKFNLNKGRMSQETQQVNYETLVNYWNNNQVIHMEGAASSNSVDLLVQTVKKLNPNVKIIENNLNTSVEGVNFPDSEELKRLISHVTQDGIKFSDQLNKMRPSLRFSIMALLSANKFNIFNKGLTEFMEMLNNGGWNSHDVKADFGAFVIDHINLFKDLDYKDDSCKKIEDLFIQLYQDPVIIDDFKRMLNMKDLIRQRRVLVTPTLYHFTVAKEEESNKVLRQYRDQLSQFIRLSFVTEELDKGYYFSESQSYLLGYIHSILKYGFYVGRGLRNNFLSYSNSQLKNHTCWYLCKIEGGLKEKEIIEKMGQFEQEKNILKRYARRGQCFSTTKEMCYFEEDLVKTDYEDIERNGFTFSDGCGLIHPEFAKLVAKQYKFSNISALQIRLGGAKGVLAVGNDPDMFKNPDDPSKEYKVLLRKSQVKFPSKNLTLDVVRWATFSQGYFNRQIITLLHCLGVPIDYFMRRQSMAKQYFSLKNSQKRVQEKIEKIHMKFGNILQNEAKDYSLDYTFMKNQRLKDLAKDLRLSVEPCKSFQATLKQALIKGFDVMSDPILSSILHSMQLNQFINLKKKARILLPDSCVLIGVVDPTGTLEENEIFVQIRRDNFNIDKHGHGIKNRSNRMEQAETINSIDSMSELIEGEVLVTRNPCTHPGDIRLLECVNRPELRYLFNVVVFSSKGERPQCNMMSGGDLDGDVYFVAWDKELLSYLKKENIHEPADYSKSQLIKEKPQSEELPDYFVFYLQRDVLGVVSNLHLKLCDHYGQMGPTNEHCISLSHMCSVAVDFAKHGECVSKKNFMCLNKIAEENPDFLERGFKEKKSQGVLGHLYRDAKSDDALKEFMNNEWKNSINLDYVIDENIINLTQHKSQMHSYLKVCYEKIVEPMNLFFKKVMMYFQLANEGELFANDLKSRLCYALGGEDKQYYTGDPGSKTEDAIQNLNTMKRQIIEKFNGLLSEIVDQGTQAGDHQARLNVSVALYLATYFDHNASGKRYLAMHRNDKQFMEFFAYWSDASVLANPAFETMHTGGQGFDAEQIQQFLRESNIVPFMEKLRAGVAKYHRVCVEAEQGDRKKMRKLLEGKKLFSIPWLLVGDTLLIHYPDKFDTAEYKEHIRQKVQRAPTVAHGGVSKAHAGKLTQKQKLHLIFGAQPADENKENIQLQQSANVSGELENDATKPSFLQVLSEVYDQFVEMNIDQKGEAGKNNK